MTKNISLRYLYILYSLDASHTYPLELHTELLLLRLLLNNEIDQLFELAMIALLFGDMQQQLLQIAASRRRGHCQSLKIGMQQRCVVGNVKFVQRLHQMLLTQMRRGQARHQRFSRKALLEQLRLDKKEYA